MVRLKIKKPTFIAVTLKSEVIRTCLNDNRYIINNINTGFRQLKTGGTLYGGKQ
jgi:hypothetical protein